MQAPVPAASGFMPESIDSEGVRRLESMSQSFEFESGQALSLQNAESQALKNLGPNRIDQTYQSRSGRQYLEALKELSYSIAAWPEGFCQSELLSAIFGPVHFDARSLEERETCHLEARTSRGFLSLTGRGLAWIARVCPRRRQSHARVAIGGNTLRLYMTYIV
jgi:hypothetical protein